MGFAFSKSDDMLVLILLTNASLPDVDGMIKATEEPEHCSLALSSFST